MLLRRTSVAAVALAVAAAMSVPTVAVAAAKPVAAAQHGSDDAGKPSKDEKSSKKIKFTASGTVTAVSAADFTVTVAAKGGTKDVRRRTVTISVPATAKVLVNGAQKTVADIAAGYTIVLTGTRSGADYTAAKVVARAKKTHTTPHDDPTPEPSETPHA